MKKVVVVLIALVFFALILVAILFKLFWPTEKAATTGPVSFPVATVATGSDAQNPEQFVRSFYQWYLENFSRDPLFPHPENREAVLSPWLTGDFLAQWDEIVSEVEVNPVLLTADDPSTWGAGITTQLVSQSVRSRTVHVTIGSGSSVRAYTVELVQTDGAWKIASVASSI
jgi:hypothetical protein